jgi:hypothetical protein
VPRPSDVDLKEGKVRRGKPAVRSLVPPSSLQMRDVSAYHVAVNDLVAGLERVTKGNGKGRRRTKRDVSDLHTPYSSMNISSIKLTNNRLA